MNRKGQTDVSIGMIMTIFIVALVGVVLFQTVAQETGEATSTDTVNLSFTAPADGGVHNFTAYRAFTGMTVTNTTGGETVGAGNYTIDNNQVVNGALVVQFTVDDAEYASEGLQISGTAQPVGYVDSAGGRALANLIPLFFALAIAIIALVPSLRSNILAKLGR